MDNDNIVLEIDIESGEFPKEIEQILKDLEDIRGRFIELSQIIMKAITLATQHTKTLLSLFTSVAAAMNAVAQKTTEIANALNQLPQEKWRDNLAVIGNVCTILQTLISLTKEHIAAKLLSKAEDIAIIALYAVDYVAALGKVVVELVKNTAEWIKNTAAKVANTAAEWAQIGVTKAWSAICPVATAVTTAFGAAINFLTSPIGLVLVAVAALIAIVVLLISNWDTVKEVAVKVWQGIVDVWNKVSVWFDENVIQPVAQFFSDMWSKISGFASNAWNGIASAFTAVAAWFDTNVIQPLLQFFSNMWSKISGFATSAWNGIVSVFQGVAAWFDKYVVQPMQKIITGIQAGFKNMVNGVIGFINGMISGIIKGINAVIGALNKLQFTVPDWVPGLGGQTLGFNLKTLTAPQIPYLAKGAVLPANKPFLAVVGDQKHGTNIEAPLATIETAVANVLSHQFGGVMAGFNALLEEQRAIRRTIEQIEIGDNVIGQAAERYAQKMAIVYGGY